MLEKGQNVEIEITDISDRGQGIGRAGGLTVFVSPFSSADGWYIPSPGDILKTELTKIKKNYAFGIPVSLVSVSSQRIVPICPHAGECGGCPLAATAYDTQKELKEKRVRETLSRIGKIKEPKVQPMLTMEEPFFYRNKAVFTVKGKKIGFMGRQSGDIAEINECVLISPIALSVLKTVRRFLLETRALMERVTVRTALTGEVMVTFDSPYDNISESNRLIQMLDDAVTDDFYSLESVILLYENKSKTLAGKNSITDIMKSPHRKDPFKFRLSAESFFQINPKMTEQLYEKVLEYADLKGTETVLDIYCGIGSIGIYLAEKAGYIIGIESSKEALDDANRNVTVNGITNAVYISGRAEEVLPGLLNDDPKYDEEIIKKAKNTDVVILDPPRAGCRRELLEAAVSAAPERIIYVSCDPATLARDVEILTLAGYNFVEATPVDMFPWTGHVETVVLMSRVKE
jgi:23S rRNA (uracil1939-C5)-methyltransferase